MTRGLWRWSAGVCSGCGSVSLTGRKGQANFGDFAGRGVFRQWEDPGVWKGMRMSHGTVEWGPDDPSKVLDFDPEMLYERVSGVSREEDVVAGFCPPVVGETPRSANVRGVVG